MKELFYIIEKNYKQLSKFEIIYIYIYIYIYENEVEILFFHTNIKL